MMRELLCNKNNCLFVLPYVSIVQEKIRSLSPLAAALQFAIEEYAGHTGSCPPRMRKSERVMYVATLEKAQFVINFLMEEGRLKEIGILKFSANVCICPAYENEFPYICCFRISCSGRDSHCRRGKTRSDSRNIALQAAAGSGEPSDCCHECDHRKYRRTEPVPEGEIMKIRDTQQLNIQNLVA